MAAPRDRRLLKEFNDLKVDDGSGVSVDLPNEADLRHMHGYVKGPPDTPYIGGTFKVDIRLPEDYPFKPPSMTLITKTWHPNVSSVTGMICLDTLARGWSPVQTIKTALMSVRAMLETPEPGDPQDAAVASQMLKDPEAWARQAHEWSKQYAGAPQQDIDFSTYRKPDQDKPIDPKVWGGYSPALVQRFGDYGFQTENIVAALKELKIPTHGGENFEPSEAMVDAVCAKLFGD